MSRTVQPSITETAFNCPHCFALTTQYWQTVYAKEMDGKPFIVTEDVLTTSVENTPEPGKAEMAEFLTKMKNGFVEISDNGEVANSVWNLHLSKCYNCEKVSVWVYGRLLFPAHKVGGQPNPDLPDQIVRDFEEAREIVNASPRGAAALLRLCVQKLCKHLGEKGENIDADIGSLVKKGLHPLVQQALDIVRVIGNEAVHPGVIDLKDDRDTALRLFDLINSITEQMISHPKAVTAMYDKLPEGKKNAIKKRDEK